MVCGYIHQYCIYIYVLWYTLTQLYVLIYAMYIYIYLNKQVNKYIDKYKHILCMICIYHCISNGICHRPAQRSSWKNGGASRVPQTSWHPDRGAFWATGSHRYIWCFIDTFVWYIPIVIYIYLSINIYIYIIIYILYIHVYVCIHVGFYTPLSPIWFGETPTISPRIQLCRQERCTASRRSAQKASDFRGLGRKWGHTMQYQKNPWNSSENLDDLRDFKWF